MTAESESNIEQARLDFDRQKHEADVVFRTKELELKLKQDSRSFLRDPLILAIIGGIVSLLISSRVAWINGDWQRDLEKQKAEANRIARDKMFDLKNSVFTVLFGMCLLFSISSARAENIEKYELPKSQLTLELEFEDESATVYKDTLVSLVDTYLVEADKLFGGPPKKLDGSVYTRLRLKLSNSGFGGGADPEFIELRGLNDTKLFGFYGWEISLLHEVLHLWSAETFRYVDGQESWFNEGVTEYLTYRIAAQLGIIDRDDVVNAFSRPIGFYLSAKGIGAHSLRSAARTDELKREHYFLVYSGGFTAGMVLDYQMRMRSNGQFTIHRLMSDLYKSHSRDKPYSTDSILKLIKKSTNLDYTDFFDRHIYGKEIIPVGNYFDIGWLLLNEVGAPIGDKEQQVLEDMLTFE